MPNSFHPAEPHVGSVSSKLNRLRAGVLGANDGIVSTAGIVVGVAAATVERAPILTAGIAGLVAGAVSMALGEYVSVSTQRDTEQALLSKERRELRNDAAAELNELVALYESRGLSAATARTVAEEHDAFAAHAEVELGIDPQDLTNPWQSGAVLSAVFRGWCFTPVDRNLGAADSVENPSHRRGGTAVFGAQRGGVGGVGRSAEGSSSGPQCRWWWSCVGDHVCDRPCGRRCDRLTIASPSAKESGYRCQGILVNAGLALPR